MATRTAKKKPTKKKKTPEMASEENKGEVSEDGRGAAAKEEEEHKEGVETDSEAQLNLVEGESLENNTMTGTSEKSERIDEGEAEASEIQEQQQEQEPSIKERLSMQIDKQEKRFSKTSGSIWSENTLVIKNVPKISEMNEIPQLVKTWVHEISGLPTKTIETSVTSSNAGDSFTLYLSCNDNQIFQTLSQAIANNKFHNVQLLAEPYLKQDNGRATQFSLPSATTVPQTKPTQESEQIPIVFTNTPSSLNEDAHFARLFSQDCVIKKIDRLPGMTIVNVEWKGNNIVTAAPTNDTWSFLKSAKHSSEKPSEKTSEKPWETFTERRGFDRYYRKKGLLV